jgi:hypothetical protein
VRSAARGGSASEEGLPPAPWQPRSRDDHKLAAFVQTLLQFPSCAQEIDADALAAAIEGPVWSEIVSVLVGACRSATRGAEVVGALEARLTGEARARLLAIAAEEGPASDPTRAARAVRDTVEWFVARHRRMRQKGKTEEVRLAPSPDEARRLLEQKLERKLERKMRLEAR